MTSNILIYGFGPYAHYRHNVTMDIIEKLGTKNLATCVVFKTQFRRKMFTEILQQHQPQVIIGLGQDSRARKIRIERKAVNWRKGLLTLGRSITKAGPGHYYVPLKVKRDLHSTVTYDAGAYVCNYSMYVICEYCQKTKAKFAFLHVPVKADVDMVVDYVANVVKGCVDAD